MSSDIPGPSGCSSIAGVCGPSMVNTSLDSPRSHYSSPSWYSNYYSWGYQPYSYGQQGTPYGQSTSASPPMAEEDSPFKVHLICGNISKCTGCGNQFAKPAMTLSEEISKPYSPLHTTMLTHCVLLENGQPSCFLRFQLHQKYSASYKKYISNT